MMQNIFDERSVLEELKHFLPTQTPLKDFIHHNSLHAFQHTKFYDAIFKSSKIFGHQATMPLSYFRKLFKIGRIRSEIIVSHFGDDAVSTWRNNLIVKGYNDHNEQRIGLLRSSWKQIYHINLDNLVQPFLFRFLCSYLDQGISIWDFPIGNKGFLESIKELESNSLVSVFKSKNEPENYWFKNSFQSRIY